MSILDQDMAFNFDYIRELQKVGIETMELAQETARQQEASLARLRSYVSELPPEIDTSDFIQMLDEQQGMRDSPLFEETKQYFQHRLTTLIERISQIDAESMKEITELTDDSRQIAWQYESLVHMVGKGSAALNMTEFQAKLNQVMEAGENAVMRELIKVEDGAFVYQWEEISRLLEQEKVSDKELAALLEVLKLAQKEKEGKEELYQQWLEQIKQALPAMEPGSHTHLAKLLEQCKELADLGVISLAQYAELESQYLWYQLSKIEQMQAIYASEMEANKDWFMTTYRMTEEEFEDYQANVLVTVELWELYEKDINAYHEMSLSEKLNIKRNPGADFIFCFKWVGLQRTNDTFPLPLVREKLGQRLLNWRKSGTDLKDSNAINALTADGSDIGDWYKMESNKKYVTEYGEGRYHFYQNTQTGEISTYDAKIKVSIPKDLRNPNGYDFWIIDLDENFIPKGSRY